MTEIAQTLGGKYYGPTFPGTHVQPFPVKQHKPFTAYRCWWHGNND